MTVKYALLNKIWIFISSDLDIDSTDPAIKRMGEEDAEEYSLEAVDQIFYK